MCITNTPFFILALSDFVLNIWYLINMNLDKNFCIHRVAIYHLPHWQCDQNLSVDHLKSKTGRPLGN